jgi:hypothetical protein
VKETRVGLGLAVTQLAKALCGARTKVPALPINASDPRSRRALIVSSLKAEPPRLDHTPSPFAVKSQHGWRLQVRFTGGFWATAIAAWTETPENQWVVLLQQHYYKREL